MPYSIMSGRSALQSIAKSVNRSTGLLESIVWVFVAVLVTGRPLLAFAPCFAGDCPSGVLQIIVRQFYSEILGAILVLLFPIVFRLTFGLLPFQALRLRRNWVSQDRQKTSEPTPYATDNSIASSEAFETVQSFRSTVSATVLAADLADKSAKLASDIYTRSGVYLLTGGLVAFSGLAFFYLRSVTAQSISPEKVPDLLNQILRLAPNFGILFFIEFIAFFFLKQYRSALDEYRYYEALKRCREENLLMLRLIEEKSPESTGFEILEKINFRSTAGKLLKDESTELLEAKKLQKDEVEVIEKFLELIGRIRAN